MVTKDQEVFPEEKLCLKCNTTKSIGEFWFWKQRNKPYHWCKGCQKIHRKKMYENQQERYKAYYHSNKDYYISMTLQRKYGITVEEYSAILLEQKGKCKICSIDTPGGKGNFHVDHCHTTGKVRGLLCYNCNIGLGNFKDTPDLLLDAYNYLIKYKNGNH